MVWLVVRSAGIVLVTFILFLRGFSASAQITEEDYFFTTAMTRFFMLDESFRPSLRIIQEYDDNIRLETGDDREGSWKTLLVPSLTLNFPGKRTSLLLDYTPAFVLYYRRDDELDVDQDASLKFTHHFTPRYWIHINNIFLRKETPQDIRRPDIPRQRNAAYNFNLAQFVLANQLTEQWLWKVEYNNERYNYDQSIMKRLFNRTGNIGEGRFQYKLNHDLRLKGSYVYRNTGYDQAGGDSYSHLYRAGCSFRIARGFTTEIWAGYQSRHVDIGQTLTGPYLEISLALSARDDLDFYAAYWRKIEDTFEIVRRGIWENGVRFRGRYKPLAKIELFVDYLGLFSYYPSSLIAEEELVSATETFWRLELGVEFQVLNKTSLELGYRRTENSSEFPGADYFRNQAYFQVAQTF